MTSTEHKPEQCCSVASLRETDPVAYWSGGALCYGLIVGAVLSLVILLRERTVTEWLPHPTTNAIILGDAALILLFWLSGFWKRMCHMHMLKKFSMRFRLLAWIFCFGGLWFILTLEAFSLAIFVNSQFDRSEPTVCEVSIHEVYEGPRGDRGLQYAWIGTTESLPSDSIPIPKVIFKQFEGKKGSLRLYIHDGLLGYRWIGRYEVLGTVSPQE
jgi:hypothetical protein